MGLGCIVGVPLGTRYETSDIAYLKARLFRVIMRQPAVKTAGYHCPTPKGVTKRPKWSIASLPKLEFRIEAAF